MGKLNRHFNKNLGSGTLVVTLLVVAFLVALVFIIMYKATGDMTHFYIGIGFLSPLLIIGLVFVGVVLIAMGWGVVDHFFPKNNDKS